MAAVLVRRRDEDSAATAMVKSMHWQHGIYLKLAMNVTRLVEKKVTEIHGKQHEVRGG
jgi:hypothetical protein